MSKHPGKIAQQMGKILVLCVAICTFAIIAISSMMPTSTYASNQKQVIVLDLTPLPTFPFPTIAVPTVPSMPGLTPTPTETPEQEPTPTETPEQKPTPTHKPKPTSTPTPTHRATSTPRPTHTTTPVPTPTQDASAPEATSVPTAAATTRPTPVPNAGIQPTPAGQAVTPEADEPSPTAQPTSSTSTSGEEDTNSTATANTTPKTPGTSAKTGTPTTQRDQGTMTALIITSSLGVTTLLTAGVLFGMKLQKKRKQAANLAMGQTSWPGQQGIEVVSQQAASSHLIDQNLMMSPDMQDILQQSPAMFMANAAGSQWTETPGQVGMPAMEMQEQLSWLNDSPAIIEQPTALIETNRFDDRDSIIEQPTALIETNPKIGAESIFKRHTEPMMTSVQPGSATANEYDTEPGVTSVENVPQEEFPPLAPQLQDIRTDPTINAMKKQAQMGIFVLLDQEKNSDKNGEPEENITQ